MEKLTFILFFVSGILLASCSNEKSPEPVFQASDGAARKRTPEPPAPISLTNPTNLRVTNITSTGATLTWDAVPNATSYRIGYRSVGSRNSTDFWIAGTTSTTSFATLPGLAPGGTFEWRVAAVYSNSYTTVAVSDFVFGQFTLLP
jgi:hypothetical protein